MSDTSSYPYATHLNIYYGPLERVDVQKLVEECRDQWYNQTLCKVNDSVVRLGVLQGEYHWHKHDKEDEFFYRPRGPDSRTGAAPGLRRAKGRHPSNSCSRAHDRLDG